MSNIHVQTKNRSLVQKYFLWLQPCQIWCLLRRKTRFHSTIYDCMRSALEEPETTCGLHATDGDCYDVFQCLFWPVIMDCHRIDLRNLVFKNDFGDFRHVEDLPVEVSERIASIRVRLDRSIRDYPMIPKLTLEQLIEIEERLRGTLEHLDEDLRGEYQSLKDISESDQMTLRERAVLFPEPVDRQLENAGVYNYWPTGRGFCVNPNSNFIVWINAEDHISLISQSNDGGMGITYERLIRATNQINQLIDFQQHPRLGYLNCSPLNIGTALQVTVQLRLLHPERLNQLIESTQRLDLHLESTLDKTIVNLSNTIRLGRTEFHIIRSLWNGIAQLIAQDMHD